MSRDGSPTLWVQHARSDGTVGAPLALGTGAFPALATSPTNMTAVAWLGGNLSDGDRTVRVTLLDAGGTIVRTTTVATLTADEVGDSPSVDVALDAAGNATVVWAHLNPDTLDLDVDAAKVGSNGTLGTPMLLGAADDNDSGSAPAVAAAPGGTAWVGWITPNAGLAVARLSSSGALDVPATRVSAGLDSVSAFRVSASAGGAAVAWVVPEPGGGALPPARIAGVRLLAGGPLEGAPFGVVGASDVSSGGVFGLGSGLGLATGHDGTVSLGWTEAGGGGLGLVAVLSRFAPGQTVAAVAQPLNAQAPSLGSLAPTFSVAPDGSLLATWLRVDGLNSVAVGGARVAPDGTIGPVSTVTSLAVGVSLPSAMLPQADDHGGGIVGVGVYSTVGGGLGWSLGTFRLDAVGPTVTVDVPATAVVLTPVRFTATVADPSDAPLTWDFGDGSSARGLSVSHVFAGPGTYTVTASATDEVGNETVVTRQITVTPAQGSDTTPPGGGPAAIVRASARLKLTKVVRTSRKVTITGTLDRRASGRVTVTWTQKVGRKTIKRTGTAKIAKGRFTATVKLTGTLAKSRTTASLNVAYAGDADTLAARATRKVKAPKKAVRKVR